jgi:two-component system, HptB-dependent secretion and biofilm response regulator
MKNILVVEDDTELCKGYSDFLADSFQIFCANNGRDALGILGKENIDLIILDLIMPDMNGVETLKKIKEAKSDVKVIILTGLGYKTVEEQLMSIGADSFLTKPIFGKNLLLEVNKLIGK